MAIVQLGSGFYHFCLGHGVWVYTSFFALYPGTKDLITRIFDCRNTAVASNISRQCPACRVRLTTTCFAKFPEVIIDQCFHCNGIWFDTGEINLLPKQGELEKEFPSPGLVSAVRAPLPPTEAQTFWPSQTAAPEAKLHPLMLFDLPVVDEPLPAAPLSVVSILIAFACLAVMIKGMRSPGFIEENSFLPLAPFRHNGFTFITSTLLHGGWSHLLINLYFLFICGDRVEEIEGPQFLATLFWLSAFVGDLAYSFSGATVPSIGASGGVVGVMTYFALRFPKNRVRLLSGPYYSSLVATLTAGQALFAFLTLQAIGAVGQLQGSHDRTNFLAHAGGAFVGVLFFYFRGNSNAK